MASPRFRNRYPLPAALLLLVWSAFTGSGSASLQVGWGGLAQLNHRFAVWQGASLFDGVEIDVRATKDGVVVGLHDATLDNETNGTGLVSDHTWRDLRGLAHNDGQPIARLIDLLRDVDAHDGFVILDVRDTPADLVKSALDQVQFPYHFARFTVFDHDQGSAYLQTIPNAQVFYKIGDSPNNFDNDPLLADLVDRGYSGVGFPIWTEFPTPALLDKLRGHGLLTFAYVVTSQAQADTATELGIDYVVSNGNVYAFPDVETASLDVTGWTMSADTLSITVSVPRWFRRLFLEVYLLNDISGAFEWTPDENVAPIKLTPTSYQLSVPTDGPRGMYRLRILPPR